MKPEEARAAHRDERSDLVGWLVLAAVGALATWLAVRGGARLGTAGAPFLGSYTLTISLASVLAPTVAAGVVAAAYRGWWERMKWPLVLLSGWLVAVLWTVSLALAHGRDGIADPLTIPDDYLADATRVGDDPLHYLRAYTTEGGLPSVVARGHPPGPILLLWALMRIGVTDRIGLGLLLTAVGAAVVPLVLFAVRGVAGDLAARRYLPVLALAPYAVWLAGGVEGVVAVLGAAMIAAGVHASDERRTGVRAGIWASVTGLLLGVAALFAYGVPWLGLAAAFLYFARRRAALNLFTGLGALIPVVAAERLGFNWVDGLMDARHDFAVRVEPHRSVLWWSGISLVVLLLAAGPALYASLRKSRNTPGWPFLVAAGIAVLFTLVTGLARGGAETNWLPYFPWLTMAAIAPRQQAGETIPTPLLLVAAGAATAIIIRAILI
ncbi:hypothetical protein [Asanoa siamensis]|uniref:Membrane protein n=1 Tax=Asanoa siamensis TaxID=926357 RepID=A0ABQ4CPD6_9ACTN|nr:hypothetical protein [Asanoa siamensis]GIF72712.1 membrane protein [Asanoa siamensis]